MHQNFLVIYFFVFPSFIIYSFQIILKQIIVLSSKSIKNVNFCEIILHFLYFCCFQVITGTHCANKSDGYITAPINSEQPEKVAFASEILQKMSRILKIEILKLPLF